MAHLFAARKAEPVRAAGFGKAQLLLDGERRLVEVKDARGDRGGARHVEIPSQGGCAGLPHEASVPVRFAQPIADDDTLFVIVKTDMADKAFALEVDREAGLRCRA